MTVSSAVCIFCEDIREEKSGQDTIVGTLPDNLLINPPPPKLQDAKALMPKLGMYLRINLLADQDQPKAVSAKVLNTDETS
jgi:hypothetical protein